MVGVLYKKDDVMIHENFKCVYYQILEERKITEYNTSEIRVNPPCHYIEFLVHIRRENGDGSIRSYKELYSRKYDGSERTAYSIKRQLLDELEDLRCS